MMGEQEKRMKNTKLRLSEASGSIVCVKSLNASCRRDENRRGQKTERESVVTSLHMVSIVEIKAKTLRLG